MSLIKRLVKGSPLTFAEGDANLEYLENLALSGSNINNYLPLTGGTINGNLTVSQNLIVQGTASINVVQYVSQSSLNIGTNLITVNTSTPSVRFGGLAVYDSGSTGTGLTGSLLWDSQHNVWIYSNPSGAAYDGAMILVGPRNSDGLGNEVGIGSNRLAKGNGSHHITSSQIIDDGTTVSISGNLVVTGSIIGFVSSASYALTASYALNGGGSVSIDTGSFATTGSNVFEGTQTIHGNLRMSGSFPLVYNNDPTTNMLFGQYDGTIWGPYYQLFGNQYTTLSQRGGAEFVYDTRNGGEAGFNIASFDGYLWVRRFRVSDVGAQITGSLDVSQGITGSLLGEATNIIGGTDTYVPLWSGSNALTSSFLNQSSDILKTIYGGNEIGLQLDFSNGGYWLGDPNAVGNGNFLNIDNLGGRVKLSGNNSSQGIAISHVLSGRKTTIGDIDDANNLTKIVIDDANQTIEVTGSLKAPNIIGSLQGTASYALSGLPTTNVGEKLYTYYNFF